MRLENAVATDVLERILSAYGFTMQKELSDKLGIAKSNVASWLQRGQVPGNVLVQCALDTGADVKWLVKGEFANANNPADPPKDLSVSVHSKELIQIMLGTGGKAVLQRIMDAYGFTTQKELSEHLGISTGTISTWVRREYFPGDVVIACALYTGAPLEWLATGNRSSVLGKYLGKAKASISRKNIVHGSLLNAEDISIDLDFISHLMKDPVFVNSNTASWIVDRAVRCVSNGKWLLGVDGKYDVYDVTVLPAKKIHVANNCFSFTCSADEVTLEGKVIITLEYNF